MSNSRKMTAPERTFERRRGCYSCKHFENEELSRKHWEIHKAARLASFANSAPMASLGDMENPHYNPRRDARMDMIATTDNLIKRGEFGLCMKGPRPKSLGGPEGDFVAATFLCDRWNGRDGHSLATAGKPLDKLGDELLDIADGRAKPSGSKPK